MTRYVLMEIPLRTPPSGVSSNFENPSFLGLPVIVTAAICLPLVLIFAAARLYARIAVVKKWRFDDYVFCLSCALGVSMIAFSLSIVFSGPNGYHAWDFARAEVAKSSMQGLLAFWIALGPMLWLLKLALFSFLLRSFKNVRWLKNCVWVGIVVTGLLFATSPIVTTITCNPGPGSDTMSYVNVLDLKESCSSSKGANAIVSDIMSFVNGFSNLYLLILPIPLIPRLTLPTLQRRWVYVIFVMGALLCVCSFAGIVYRVKSWQTTDITGNQIPFYVAYILEIALSLILPCTPSAFTLYRHFTVPEIREDTTPIMRSSEKSYSSITVSSPPTTRTISRPPTARTISRKHDLSIEGIPYSKASSEYSRQSAYASRMKALPATPLPVATVPLSPLSPASFRSMNIPIMFQRLSRV